MLRLFGFATLFGIAAALVFGLGVAHAAEDRARAASLADTLLGPAPVQGRIELRPTVSVVSIPGT